MSFCTTVRQGAWLTLLATAGCLSAFSGSGVAEAQPWPTRPVTAMVPLAAGSASDVMTRVVLDQVSKQLGQPVVVENRAGAGGTIGANVVAKAAPDGHMILAAGALGAAHALYPKLPYDALRDFVPVIPLGQQPLVIV